MALRKGIFTRGGALPKIIFLLTLMSWTATSTFCQETYSVTGSISGEKNIKLADATVTILKAVDSSVVQSVKSLPNGRFTANKLIRGSFILLIRHIDYVSYIDNFSLDSLHRNFDFRNLSMVPKTNLLKEVTIKGALATLKIKGDTTEYGSQTFKVEPNSKVEDLLRQLPGIVIDKDGRITVQGEKVNKVFLDGEEFFGDDPILVTRNIRGDMVDKVQLFDKKSDQAAFTGIKDGIKNKTINIKLKKDKNTGYFGKTDLGVGNDSYYQGQAMFNQFGAKAKFSAFGILGNTGKTGLNGQDNNRYSVNGSDDLAFNGEGLPKVYTGGIHYDTKWAKEKKTINSNYKIGTQDIDAQVRTYAQNNLANGILNSDTQQSSRNSAFRQKIDGTYNHEINPLNSLKVIIDGEIRRNQSNNNFQENTKRSDGSFINQSDRQFDNKENRNKLNTSIFFGSKFKKEGRSFALNLEQSIEENRENGLLNVKTYFYDKPSSDYSKQVIDQLKNGYIRNINLGVNATYSEPLLKHFAMIGSYGFSMNNSILTNESFNMSVSGQYDQIDSLFSNDLNIEKYTHQAGTTFYYAKEKNLFNFGTRIENTIYRQYDRFANTSYNRNFLYFLPQLSYQYNFSQERTVKFDYVGNTTQPSAEQLQPLKQNIDPLNVILGNSMLKPGFSHKLNLRYNSHRPGQNASVYLTYTVNSNAIISNASTDTLTGKNIWRYSNLRGRKPTMIDLYIHLNKTLKENGLQLGLDLSTNSNVYYNFVNDVLNRTNSNMYRADISLSQFKLKHYFFRVSLSPNYNTNESLLQSNINNNGWQYFSNALINIYLPKKLMININADYQLRQKTPSFPEKFERLTVNTSINKSFLKAENLTLSLSANDLLNQNTGFSNNAFNNVITQRNFSTIKRYIMLSLVWDFNKMGASPR